MRCGKYGREMVRWQLGHRIWAAGAVQIYVLAFKPSILTKSNMYAALQEVQCCGEAVNMLRGYDPFARVWRGGCQ